MLTAVSIVLVGMFLLSFVTLRLSYQRYIVLGTSVGLQGLVVVLNPPGDLISGVILGVVGAVIFLLGILMSVEWKPKESEALTSEDYRFFVRLFLVLAVILIARSLVFIPVSVQNGPPLLTCILLGLAIARFAYSIYRQRYR